MPRLIGMDEAGLGPNLGPFVVAVTVWDVPDSPFEFDFWRTFDEVLTNSPKPNEIRLHVADSKQVFQPKRGFADLERSVLAALQLNELHPKSFDELCQILSPNDPTMESAKELKHPQPMPRVPELTNHQRDEPAPGLSPWNCGPATALPSQPHNFSIVESWKRICERQKIRLVAIKAAIIEPQRFNELIRQYDNKSLVVSRTAFQLLRSVWAPDETETFVVGDKHGGRNRYDDLLAEVLDDEMIFRLEEGADRSDYRVGKTVLRFQPRAEEHGPVALASMTAKYVRELAMTQFNHFWVKHIPGLKPTQGYPVDAKRFRDQIASKQRELNISDDVLWRNR